MFNILTYYTFKVLFACLFIIGGIAHFISPDFYLPMMPSYLPYHLGLIYVSGIAEVILGVGLLIPKYSKHSAIGLILLLIAIFPANINMYLNHQNFPDLSEMFLLIRLPIQLILLFWAYLYTRNTKKDSNGIIR